MIENYIILKTYIEIIGAILGIIIILIGTIYYFVQMRKIDKEYNNDEDIINQ